MIPRNSLRFVCALLSSCLIGSSIAGVIINEFSAESSQWRLKWDAAGQPSVGAGPGWWSPQFSPHAPWLSGTAPLGWGYGDIATDLSGNMRNQTPQLYLRKSISLAGSVANSGSNLLLDIDYDDGCIVWINGIEVARCNMGPPKMQIYHEQFAFNADSGSDQINLGPASALLDPGLNLIAIQAGNSDEGSNFKIEAELSLANGSSVVDTGETWDYFVGHVEPSGGLFDASFLSGGAALQAPWAEIAFNDSAWSTSPGPIGYDSSNDYNLGINLINQMRNIATSVYMRQDFNMTAAQISAAGGLSLTVDYDDGFVAFLNGTEIARGTMGAAGDFYPYNATSDAGHNASMDGGGNNPGVIETFNFDTSLLVPGTNVLSVQLHNSGIGSSDLVADVSLATTAGGGTVVAPNNGTFSYFVGLSEPSAPGGSTGAPPEADFSDWIELHNDGVTAVDLTGWSISDDSGDPTKFVFPSGTSIPANGYLLLFADDNEEFNATASELHTSFNLSSDGEFLGLYDAGGVSVDALSPDYPSQRIFQSYGRQPGGIAFGYLDFPTPGSANAGTYYADRVDAPDFSIPGGFHSSGISVTLTSETPSATIRYTTDGTDPTLTNGTTYTGPLALNPISNKTGHCIRARAFVSGLLPSRVKTHNYLIAQSASLTGVPALLFSGDEEEVFYKPNGVLAIDGGQYVNSQWQAVDKDDYNIPFNRGRPYERAAFVEYFEPDGDSFREEAGIRIAASGYSRPRMILNQTGASPFPSDPNQKPSFNIWFRGDYGDSDVDFPWVGEDYNVKRFEQLRIRAGKNDIRNPFIVDELVRRLYHDMGQESALGVINTLYINGELKGFYNMCERLREPFMRDHHDSDGQWDIRQVNEFAEGDATAWNEMFTRISQNLDIEANWDAALEYIDPVAIADYYLVNAYSATWDWPQNNWVAARERSPDGRFRFYVWDAEGGFHSQGYFNPITHNTISTDLLTKTDTNSRVFQELHDSAEWRLIFADRVQKHMFNDGAIDDRDLSSSNIRTRKDQLVAEFQPLLTFVHNQTISQGWYNNWVNPSSGRRGYLLGPTANHFRDNDLWPVTTAPVFNQHGGDVNAGFGLSMTKAHPGTIYYTLDGSDPREFGGAIAPGALAYTSSVPLNALALTASARVRNSNGEWSPLTCAEFNIGTVPATSSNLAVVEIMYHPVDPSPAEIAAGYTSSDDFEFVQLQNYGTQPIDLAEVRFSSGISFDFANAMVTAIGPGDNVILVENLDAFRMRYGTGFDSIIAGQYGGKLSNGGEPLLVDDASGTIIQSFAYEDDSPWPDWPDGNGLSLQIIDPAGNHGDPTNWRHSVEYGGTPGGSIGGQNFASWQSQHFTAAQLANSSVSGPNADADCDGLSNFLEYALGSLPWNPESHIELPFPSVQTVGGSDYLTMIYQRWEGAAGVSYQVQTSDDLDNWVNTAVLEFGPVDNGDGTQTYGYRDTVPLPADQRRFIRLWVTD